LARIEELMKLIKDLQAKLQTARGEVADLIASTAEEGAENDDVRKVQELLASDPTLFSGRPTGFFGPMTRQAIMRFQERYGLEQTGRLDEATREAMNELRKERKNGMMPPGLLQSATAKERVRARLQEKWGNCDFTRPIRDQKCERIKMSDNDDSWSQEEKMKAARVALARAQARLNALERILDRRDYDRRITNMLVEKAQKRLRDARAKLREAQVALSRDPEKAEDLAEAAEDLVDEGAEAVDVEEVVDEAADEAEQAAERDTDEDDDEDESDDDDDSDTDDDEEDEEDEEEDN
jgi:hypothetical protein